MANAKISELPILEDEFEDNDLVPMDDISGSTPTTKKSRLVNFWNYIKNKASSWFGITVTESEGSITGRSFEGTATQNYVFTYVVDSDQRLADWANNVDGNDYTSVLIKKGEYTLTNQGVNLSSTGTKVIVGETGSVINVTNSSYSQSFLRYDSVPSSNGYYIYGLTINILHSNGNAQGISYVRNIYNCVISSDGGSASSPLRFCENIYNCSITSVARGISGNNANCFYSCKNIVNSKGESSATNRADARVFNSCENVENCIAVGGSVENNRLSYGFSNCMGVRYCSASGQSAAYYQSYSSPTADPTYACSNTLEGGWNT